MEGQNRKNTKNEKSPGNNLKTDVNKADKEKIKELARKRQELDELKGNTAKGKAACIVVFLLMIGLSFGLFVSMVKLDAGGFASEVLAPAIADIPVLRSILPAQMQKKSASELAAEQAQAQAEAERMQAQAQAEAEAAQAQAQAQAEAATAQAQAEAARVQAEEKAALQDYVDTYSAMKPQNAAKLFESMIPNKEDVVISILENLTPEERAAILSNMNITNAADLTDKMRK